MGKQRRSFGDTEKMGILREHLLDRVPVSKLCDKYDIQPTQLYQWQKKLFEEGGMVFRQPRGKSSRQRSAEATRIEKLEAKVQEKNEVLAELMGEHVALKKSLGEI